MKVVINACFGGFSLSPEAELKLWERGVKEIGTPVDEYYPPAEREAEAARWPTMSYRAVLEKWREYKRTPKKKRARGMFLTVFSPDEQFVLGARDIRRDHPELIRVVEEMGEDANGACASLKVVEIPDGVSWHVEEYDGNEHVAEDHRTWY